VGCGRAPSHGKSSTESLNSHWRLRPGTAGCGLNSPCADRSANGEDSGARSQLAGEGVRPDGSRLRSTEGEEEESIIAPAAAPASASSSAARRSRRQGADVACDSIMIAVVSSASFRAGRHFTWASRHFTERQTWAYVCLYSLSSLAHLYLNYYSLGILIQS
jgi:hypothetical protein